MALTAMLGFCDFPQAYNWDPLSSLSLVPLKAKGVYRSLGYNGAKIEEIQQTPDLIIYPFENFSP